MSSSGAQIGPSGLAAYIPPYRVRLNDWCQWTDNSAAAIIVKGMLDRALIERGKPPIARSCEVPEFKHACLGGVYGMKSAIRHLALDGAGSQAIVVCADIAEYARGSSGEPTQGAGAVAMLIEKAPK